MIRASSASLARAGEAGTQTQHKNTEAAVRIAAQAHLQQLTERTLDCYKKSLQSEDR
jgi:hypothetical protein